MFSKLESLPIFDEKATLLNGQIKILLKVNIFTNSAIKWSLQRVWLKKFADIFYWNFRYQLL